VPDNLIGTKVRCSTCEAIFVAETAEPSNPVEESGPRISQAPPLPPPPPVDDDDEMDEPPRRRRRRWEDEDDFGPRGKRRDLQPHRGTTILILGIVSILFCGPLGLVTSIPAWVMGRNDLRGMREGRIDGDGEGLTMAGYVMGIIMTVISALILAAFAFFIVLAIASP
jgi:hypothetical protein